MAIKYTNIFHSIAIPFKIFPNWDFWFRKNAIWQPRLSTPSKQIMETRWLRLFKGDKRFLPLAQKTSTKGRVAVRVTRLVDVMITIFCDF
jgi:hypothetical protein